MAGRGKGNRRGNPMAKGELLKFRHTQTGQSPALPSQSQVADSEIFVTIIMLSRAGSGAEGWLMPRCQRCHSRGAKRGYCPACLSFDPFPRKRWIVVGVGLLAFAGFLVLAIYLASR